MTDSSRTEPAAAESQAAEAPLRFADLDLPAPLLSALIAAQAREYQSWVLYERLV